MIHISFKNINNDYHWGKYGDFKVIIMKENGYINATKLIAGDCTNNGNKKFNDWSRGKNNKKLMNEISSFVGIPVNLLYNTISTGPNNLRGTYVHPLLMTHIAYWVSPKFSAKVGIWIEEWKSYSKQNEVEYYESLSQLDSYQNDNREKIIQKKLQKKLGGKTEVETPVGNIDLLTKSELIEIKSFDNWKHALGQLIAYSTFYPNKEKCMYLFDSSNKSVHNIKKICKANDIRLVIYD